MKILITLALLCPLLSFAQKKGDNTIQIDTAISYSDLKMLLFDKGYFVESNDTNFITTSPKSMKTACVNKIIIARNENKTFIKGLYKISVELVLFNTPLHNEFEPVEYVKSKGNITYQCWQEMNAVATSITNKITYLKK